VDIGRR